MSKAFSVGMLTHLEQEVTTVAFLIRITRRDGEVFRFTNHDRDIVVGSETFSATSGMFPTVIAQKRDMSVDHIDIEVFVDADQVDEVDVIAGLFDYAVVDIMMVNWQEYVTYEVT